MSAAASYTLGGRAFGGTVLRADLTQSTRAGDAASLTYSGGLYVPRLPALGVGLNATGSVWTRDGQQSIYALTSVTHSFGRAYVSLGYQFQQTPLLTESLTTHGTRLRADPAHGRRLRDGPGHMTCHCEEQSDTAISSH